MRRDPATKRWSWKDSNIFNVKLNVLHVPSNKYVYVTDQVLNDMLVVNKRNYFWSSKNMTFRKFFCVPAKGIKVQG